MAKAPNHDELLEAAVEAFYQYEKDIESAKERRSEAFAKALRSTVTGRELAQKIGISESMVSHISKGRR